MNCCPVCGEQDKWYYTSGVINGEPIEPAEWWCESCGFNYAQGYLMSMQEAALDYKDTTGKLDK